LTIGIVMPNVSASWKPSGAEQLGPHLAGEGDRAGTESIIASVKRRDDVRRARPGGREDDARPCPTPWRSPRRMAAARLVADQDVADARVHERVVGREVRTARVAEYDVDALRP
jgi:hypothetical protein